MEPEEESESWAKVLLLIENYLNFGFLRSFSLVADTNYIMQNSIRLLRALFELCVKKHFDYTLRSSLRTSIIVQRRMLEGQTEIRQFAKEHNVGILGRNAPPAGYIKGDIINVLEKNKVTLEMLFDEDQTDVREVFPYPTQYDELRKFVSFMPRLNIKVEVKPITRTILKIYLTCTPHKFFKWSDRWNGAYVYIYIYIYI